MRARRRADDGPGRLCPCSKTRSGRAIESGVPTVYLSFTSGLSGSFDVALPRCATSLLAEHPEAELYLVDTYAGLGGRRRFWCTRPSSSATTGLTARELAEWASEARFFVDAEFMVEDLESLRRGGRIPGSVAYAGSKLDVKPLLTIAHRWQALAVRRGARAQEGHQTAGGVLLERRVADQEGPGRCVVVGPVPTARRTPTRLKEMLATAGREHPVLGVRASARSSAAMWGRACWPWCFGEAIGARSFQWPIASPARSRKRVKP